MNAHIPTLERNARERDAAELRGQRDAIEGHARAMKDEWRRRIGTEPNEAVQSVMRYAEGALFDWAADHLFAEADQREDEAAALLEPLDEEDRADERSDYYAGLGVMTR